MTTQTEALKLADALNELLESFEKDGRFCKSSSIRNELYDRLKKTLEESKETLQSNEQVDEHDWNDEQLKMLNFLYGSSDFDGVWFEQRHPTERAAFWWRKHLKRLFAHPPVPTAQPEQEYKRGYADAMNWKVQNHLEHLPAAQPEQEPVAFEEWLSNQHGDPEEIGFLQALRIAYISGQDSITAIKEALAQPEQEPQKGECTWCGGDCPQFECDTHSTWMNEPVIQRDLPPQHKEPEQEPVAFETWYEKFHSFAGKSPLLYSDLHCAWQAAKLYTTPPQRTWVGLTDEEIEFMPASHRVVARWAEAKLKEKNT